VKDDISHIHEEKKIMGLNQPLSTLKTKICVTNLLDEYRSLTAETLQRILFKPKRIL